MTHFEEPELHWLAGTDIGEVGARDTVRGASITMEGWHDYGRGCGSLHSITVVCWHGYGLSRGK